jgi:hypothetical protein
MKMKMVSIHFLNAFIMRNTLFGAALIAMSQSMYRIVSTV